MASKWREFECDVLGNVLFNGYNPEGKNIERIVVVERAALDEALELIGELEDDFVSITQEVWSLGGDAPKSSKEIAMPALAKIKAFKDRMNESTTTEIKGEG